MRVGAIALAVVVVSLARPPAALAHIATGDLSTTFKATVTGFRPPAPGLRAKVLGGDLKLQLSAPAADRVLVLGLVGEPFVRFDSSGVWVNLGSPTAATAGMVSSSQAVTGRVVWHQVTGGHTLAWHENRLRPVSIVAGGGVRPVGRWSVPMVVNGQRTTLTGVEWWGPPPPLWPWIASGLAALAAAALAARYVGRETVRRVALALVFPVVVALVVGWAGIFLVDQVSAVGLALSAVAAAITVVFAGFAVAAASGPAQTCVAGVVGATAATFAIPQLTIFAHAFVRSALSATPARLMMWIALVGGTALVALCVPAVVELLERSPFEALRPPPTTR
jgi:hypothetical protein